MTRFTERQPKAVRDTAYISAIATDNGYVEIRLCEYWNDSHIAYINLSPEQAVMFADELKEIVNDAN